MPRRFRGAVNSTVRLRDRSSSYFDIVGPLLPVTDINRCHKTFQVEIELGVIVQCVSQNFRYQQLSPREKIKSLQLYPEFLTRL